jgi:NAD(P)-dependent dehydrogenase (short-subunit alcohol dehydrogenase family)
MKVPDTPAPSSLPQTASDPVGAARLLSADGTSTGPSDASSAGGPLVAVPAAFAVEAGLGQQDISENRASAARPDQAEPLSGDVFPGAIRRVVPEQRGDASVAIVTGAARRVGREIALTMAKRGLAVVVHHGTSAVEADALVQRICAEGGRAIAVAADLRDPRTAASAVFEAAAELGEVTTLINSASVFQDRTLPWIDLYHCNAHLSVNLLAPIFLSQQLIRQLGEGHRGHIINILDWRAERPGADHLVYTATKAALSSVTRSLALQLAPLVQVNGIAPGAILPPDDRLNWHEQRAISSIPLRRTGTPKELTRAIDFLLDSDFITGEVITVSGGEGL